MNKPKYLYRGISVKPSVFNELDFNSDILPVAPPQYDEQGRPTVGDGNEYGIYMTDNKQMVFDAYGNCRNKNQFFAKIGKVDFVLPYIGVSYIIDTDNLDVKNPWITKALQGHYNNGFGGKEWITQKIPTENYSLLRVMIGSDTLNEPVVVDINEHRNDLKEYVNSIIEKRFEGMKRCIYHASKRPVSVEIDLRVYKELFSIDGVAFDDKNTTVDENNPESIIRNLIKKEYEADKENLHFAEIGYLISLKTNYKFYNDKQKLIEKVQKDRENLLKTKNYLISNHKTTNHLDKTFKQYELIINSLNANQNQSEK